MSTFLKSELSGKLREINETWAVVQLGNRVRYLHETVDGDLELYDAKSLANGLATGSTSDTDGFGRLREVPIIKAW